MSTSIPLRDVHSGIAPALWPPAPGWWMLAGLAVVAIAVVAWWRWRKRRRFAAILRLFNEAVDRAQTPSQKIAAMSEVLRRTARRIDPSADRLQGDDWLRFLDHGMPQPVFSAGAGALLLDGGFRADVGVAQADALQVLARLRYTKWMQVE